jgi:hypothetical protein
MTRGKIIIITDWDNGRIVLNQSCEFNGDMYIEDGHGEFWLEKLKEVKTPAEFYKAVLEFDKKNFEYQYDKDDYFQFYRYLKEKPVISLRYKYFENWFSDYLYFVNRSSQPVNFLTRGGGETELKPDEIGVFCFGELEKIQGEE